MPSEAVARPLKADVSDPLKLRVRGVYSAACGERALDPLDLDGVSHVDLVCLSGATRGHDGCSDRFGSLQVTIGDKDQLAAILRRQLGHVERNGGRSLRRARRRPRRARRN